MICKNKTFLAILIFSMLGILVNSCRKGEQDPFISLKSRNQRIAGTWNLVKYEEVSKNIWVNYVMQNNATTKLVDSTVTRELFENGVLKTNIIYVSLPSGGAQSTVITNIARQIQMEITFDNETLHAKFISGSGNIVREENGYTTIVSNWNANVVYESKGTWHWDNSKKSKYGIITNAKITISIPYYIQKEMVLAGDLLKLSDDEMIVFTENIDKQNINMGDAVVSITGNAENSIFQKWTFRKKK